MRLANSNISRFFVCLLLLATTRVARSQATYGEVPRSDNMLWAASCTKGPDNWQPIQPYVDNTVGVLMLGQSAPAQDMPMFAAWIGSFVKEGTVFVLGYDAFPIYENSPPSAWTNFGPRWDTPSHLNPTVEYVREAPQYLHIDPAHMWEQLGGDPTNPAAWASLGTSTPAVGSGTNGVSYQQLFPPGPLWEWAMQKAQGRIDPKGPPGGGALTGINLVMQLGVLNGNGANGTPEVNLSNALALTVTPGPPLKINMTGGNHGNGGEGLIFQGTNISPATKVTFQSIGGAALTAPVQMVSGSLFGVRIPNDATSGSLTFNHPAMSAPVSTVGPTHFVRRFGPLTDLSTTPMPSWTSTLFGGGSVQGVAIHGLASTTGLTVTIPPVLTTSSGTLTLSIYTYDPAHSLAGVLVGGQTFGNVLSVMTGAVGSALVTAPFTPTASVVQGIQVTYNGALGAYAIQVNPVFPTLGDTPFLISARFTP